MEKFLRKILYKWFGIVSTAKWSECTKASCWHGNNAEWRMMNMLSPNMPDAVFNERMKFMKDRGCNTAHLILTNLADGEFGRYCIYGNSITWKVNKNFVKAMKKRLEKLYLEGFHIVLWVLTDDSTQWNKEIMKNPLQYCKDLKEEGFFEFASTVVAGLEMNEYLDAKKALQLIESIRVNYGGKVGVHHTSGKTSFAPLADILFYQINPTTSATNVETEVKGALRCGLPVNMFELSRHEDRILCETALKAGAFGVGNW